MVVDHLGGSGKLSYKLTELRNALCGVHVLLDHDDAGRMAAEKAEAEKLLRPVDVHYTTCLGKKSSEWEDLVAVDLYNDWVSTEYGVHLSGSSFQNSKPWSERVRDTFLGAAKTWNEKIRTDIKVGIAELIEKSPAIALNSHTRAPVEQLQAELERKVSTRSSRPP